MFRTYLDSQGFIEIHTPKLQGSATESGASVFEVNYFGRSVYLAQVCNLALLLKRATVANSLLKLVAPAGEADVYLCRF